MRSALRRAARRPLPAYLLIGPAGVTRRLVAVGLAAAILCQRDGCGSCSICRTVLAGEHLDVSVTIPAEAESPVAAARAMASTALVAPRLGDRRVLVLDSLEELGEAGGSALLKIVEEPPASSVFILLAGRLSRTSATLASRCATIHLEGLASDLLPVEVADEWRSIPDRLGTGLVALAEGICETTLGSSPEGRRQQGVMIGAGLGELMRALRDRLVAATGDDEVPALLSAINIVDSARSELVFNPGPVSLVLATVIRLAETLGHLGHLGGPAAPEGRL